MDTPTAPPRLLWPEYGWLLLPLAFAFLAFPLVRVILAGLAFMWVAPLLLQRRRGTSYLRSLVMTASAMLLWLALCALATHLAEDAFRWGGATFADEASMVVSTLMLTFVFFSVMASLVVVALRIGGVMDAGVLFLCLMCVATGAVLSGQTDILWAFPVSTFLASGLFGTFLCVRRGEPK